MSRRWRSILLAAVAAVLMLPALTSVMRAAADWPPSRDVVVGEVVTGGAAGSDEYFEIYNGGDLPVQLDGLEVVYVTATGSTVTTKHRWTNRQLAPWTAISSSPTPTVLFAGLADHTYTGGLSAAGGSLVLRVVGGAVIDSLSWGTAASAFVEGSPGAAPPAGASLERLPGGAGGNGRDTNDNAADTVHEPDAHPGWLAVRAGAHARAHARARRPTRRPSPPLSPTPEPDARADPEPDTRADARAHP